MSDKKWVMPEWMKGYERIIGSRTGVEYRMNEEVNFTNVIDTVLIITCRAQVRTLGRLREEGLLKEGNFNA